MKIAVICGGPSLERGISMNSARSVLDHLEGEGIEIVPIYFDYKRRAYHISKAQLYSNTPSDFDFKLQSTAKFLSKNALKQLLKQVDLAFPVMHGQFGEDGGIQRILERCGVPYVGSPVEACKRCFNKHEANEFIRQNGFFALPSALLKIFHDDHEQIIRDFFKTHQLKRAIVKPATGGSSIGVFSVNSPEEALEAAERLFSKRMDTQVVIEPFCQGIEFTVILLENRFGMPVAILPTEIEIEYANNQIFDFRRKYLPTRQVTYHCPPRFDNETIERIQVQAEQLFKILGMRDFARFDGWLLPDGNLWFSDFNPISGMEQNSFLFQQSSRIGMSHRDLLRFIVKNVCQRNGIPFPKSPEKKHQKRKPVHVLFGGQTSEREVARMTGTNVWLKLRQSERYEPKPFLLDIHGDVWHLPYTLALNHTVEEIYENCITAKKDEERLHFLIEKVKLRLAADPQQMSEPFFLPQKMSLKEFIKRSPFVFIGLHGGIGEDGTLQRMLNEKNIPFNGPGEKASKLCMDKHATMHALKDLRKESILTAFQKTASVEVLLEMNLQALRKYWEQLQKELHSKKIIVKPRADGCSSGVVRLEDAKELKEYLRFASRGGHAIPKNTFRYQQGIVEMPITPMKDILFENFIETDTVRIKGNHLKSRRKKGWIEVTVGVVEDNGKMRALNPSLTVAEGAVLSVEEKFQGGTGVNITPPPEEIVNSKILQHAKQSIEKVAERLGLQGYSRMDTFLNVDTGEILIIEVNSVPALTPSTVLFHQALAEPKPIYPREFIEKLVENKGY